MKAKFTVALLAVAMICTFSLAQSQDQKAQNQGAQYWYEKGLKLEANQSFEEAVQAYDNATKLDPKNPEFWDVRALSLYFLHRTQEATESWEKALQLYNGTLEKNPKDINAWIGKGRAFTLLALSDKAELRETYRVAELNAYEQALQIDPQNSTLLYFKGSALYELKRYDEAIEACDQALKIGFDPSQPWMADGASHLKGLAEAALGRKNESAQSYQESLKGFDEAIKNASSPQNLSEAWAEKGMILEEQGNYNESVKAFDNATIANPKNEMAWRIKGFMLASWMGRYQEGLTALDKALEINPTADVWEAKARIFNELGRYQDAIDASEKSLALNQNLTTAWRDKGQALLGQGKYQEAIDAYSRDESSDDEALFAGRGFALTNLSRSDEAVAAFNKSLNISEAALQEDNKSAHAWFWKGEALRGLGRYQEALDAYNRSLENGKDYAISSWRGKGYALKAIGLNAEADDAFAKANELGNEVPSASAIQENAYDWIGRGNALAEHGDYQGAIRALDNATKLSPQDKHIWMSKGLILAAHLGRFNESIEAYDRALQIDPKDADAWFGKGAALNKTGRYEEAVLALDKATDLNPELAPAWKVKGDAFKALGRQAEADAAYTKAGELGYRMDAATQDTADDWFKKGQELMGNGSKDEGIQALDKALQLYNESIKQNPKDINALLGKADILARMDLSNSGPGAFNGSRSLAAYDEVLKIDPKNIDALIGKGFLLFELGFSEKNKYNESLETLDEALRIDPKDPLAWDYKGSVFMLMGKYNESVEAYDRAIENIESFKTDRHIGFSNRIEELSGLWLSRGVTLQMIGRINESLNAFDKAVQIDPRNYDAWMFKGQALDRMGKYNDSASAFENASNAVQSVPTASGKAYAWISKADVLVKSGRYEEAKTIYDKSIGLNYSTNSSLDTFYLASAWRGEGSVLAKLGKYNQSLEAFNESIKLGSWKAFEAWTAEGDSLRDIGRYNESLKAYDKAIETAPNNYSKIKAWIGKGNALGKMGRQDNAVAAYKEAINDCDESLKQYSQDGEVWYYKGNALKALGNQAEANAAFTKAKELGYVSQSQ